MKSQNKKLGQELPLKKQTCSQRKRTLQQTLTLDHSTNQITSDYLKELYAQALRTTTNINNENYWKNTYLNLLKKTGDNAYANIYANVSANNYNNASFISITTIATDASHFLFKCFIS